jgi:hypothetical protein
MDASEENSTSRIGIEEYFLRGTGNMRRTRSVDR